MVSIMSSDNASINVNINGNEHDHVPSVNLGEEYLDTDLDPIDKDTDVDTDLDLEPAGVELDLSCFPLLRMDQLHLHTKETLLQSRTQLRATCMAEHDESEDIRCYASRLLLLIEQELSESEVSRRRRRRRVCSNRRSSPANKTVHVPVEGRIHVGLSVPVREENKEKVDNHTVSYPRGRLSPKRRPADPNSNNHHHPENSNNNDNNHNQNFIVTSNIQTKGRGTRTDTGIVTNTGTSGSGCGFKARAKARNIALKHKRHRNTPRYKQAQQTKEKQLRKKQATERIEQRRLRRELREAREVRLRVRREKKLEERRERERRREEVRLDMERAAMEAMPEQNDDDASDDTDDDTDDDTGDNIGGDADNNDLGKEEKQPQMRGIDFHIHAATAAALVMDKASIHLNLLDDSDSGSSLTSDVDYCEYECSSTYCIVNSDDDDAGEGDSNGGVFLDYTRNNDTDDANCAHVFDAAVKEEITEIYTKETYIEMNSYDDEPKDNATAYEQRAEDDDSVVAWDSGVQDKHTLRSSIEENVEWQPWSPMKYDTTTTEFASSVVSCTNSRKKQSDFTRVFPTFNNIFTVHSHVRKELRGVNLSIERECLEYQINVLTNLLQLQGKDKGHESEGPLCATHTDIKQERELKLFSTKSVRPEVTEIISDVLSNQDEDENARWKDVSSKFGSGNGNCWNLLWTWKKPKLNPEHLLVWQRISRFPDTSCLTRKDYLKKHLEAKLARSSSSLWNIMPLTYVLPKEFTSFLSAFSSIRKTCELHDANSNLWIMKPVGMSRGRGISLINDIGKVTYSSPTVIQKYLTNPLLFNGYKFDLRIYILVTSFSPLEAFIYEEGFARFGSRPFSSSAETLDDLQIHLTNSSIQKNYDHSLKASHPVKIAGKDGGGNKVKISWLFERLKSQGLVRDKDLLWSKVQELCLRTLITVSDKIPNQPNAFEIFGFDVMIDDNTKPWLIEVNSCPALSRDHKLDIAVKESMIEDTITLISPPNYNRQALSEICKRRLQKKRSSTKDISDNEILDLDLRKILNNQLPRQYGEDPKSSTGYQRLAPGSLFDHIRGRR